MGDSWQVITVDCLEVMRGMESGSMDAVVMDPPSNGKARTAHAGAGSGLEPLR